MTKKMADSRVEESHEYMGLGFPIVLKNVEFKYFYGDYQPVIDIKKVSDLAIRQLAVQEKDFSGSELNFVRSYFQQNHAEFAAAINCSKKDLMAWEDQDKISMPKNVKDHVQQYIQKQLAKDNSLDNTKKPLLSGKNMFTAADKKTSDVIDEAKEQKSDRKNFKK